MNSRLRVKLLGLAVTVALLTIGAGVAPGGSGFPGAAPLSLVAGPGENNHVTVGLVGSEYRITDTAGVPSVSPSCRRISATAAACPAGLVSSIVVDLKDGDDRFAAVGGGIAVPYSVER
jgi:hypothetical protein